MAASGTGSACPQCGSAVARSATWCERCGRPLALRRSRSLAIPIALVAAVVLVAAGAGAGLLLRSPAASPAGVVPQSGSTAGAATAGPVAPEPDELAFTVPEADPAALMPRGPEVAELPATEAGTPITGHLALGAVGDLGTTSIPSAGGTITVDGLRLEIPAGALAADTRFSISAAPITDAGFEGLVTPLTPLFTVTADGAADVAGEAGFGAPVTVTLAGLIPEGQVALAFYYDEAAGTIVPMTPLSQDGAGITVAALHFSSVFAGVVDWARVPEIVDSGFRPAVDDWQFTNDGSFASPNGHCAGQVLSAIWYYDVQRRGAGAASLYGLFDNNGAPDKTPGFQWDDADGYRFASEIQLNRSAAPLVRGYFRGLRANPDDAFTYDAFRLAIWLTKSPQYLSLGETGQDGGHAVAVYAVTPDALYIADPNYPRHVRTVAWDAVARDLHTYNSGANAAAIRAGGETVYDQLAYIPWESFAATTISPSWAGFEAGTAGDRVFPAYALAVQEGMDSAGKPVWTPLVNGYATAEPTITIGISPLTGGSTSTLIVYPGVGTKPIGPDGATQVVDLAEGENPLGFSVWGAVETGKRPDGTAIMGWRFVDFVRLTVVRGAASPTPATAGTWTLTMQTGEPKETNTAGHLVGSGRQWVLGHGELGGPAGDGPAGRHGRDQPRGGDRARV